MNADQHVAGAAAQLRLPAPVCPVCNAALQRKRMGATVLHFCPAGHGAAINGETLAAHDHRRQDACAMHDAVNRAPRAGAHCAPRRSPWCPGSVMEPREIEGVTIDYCATERGVWLDAQEILAIVNAMRERAPAKTAHETAYGAVRELGGVALDIASLAPEVWMEPAIGGVARAATHAAGASKLVVDAIGPGVEAIVDGMTIGEIAGAIVEFIADALW